MIESVSNKTALPLKAGTLKNIFSNLKRKNNETKGYIH